MPMLLVDWGGGNHERFRTCLKPITTNVALQNRYLRQENPFKLFVDDDEVDGFKTCVQSRGGTVGLAPDEGIAFLSRTNELHFFTHRRLSMILEQWIAEQAKTKAKAKTERKK